MQYKNFFDFEKKLARGSLAPVHFLYGPEAYIESRSLRALRRAVQKQADGPVQRLVLFGDEAQDVKHCFTSYKSFCLEHQLIILKRAEALKADLWQPLFELCQHTNPTAHLVIVASKIDKRKKVMSQFLKHLPCLPLNTPAGRDLPLWLKYIARDLQLSFDPLSFGPGLEAFLCDLLGSNLSHMHSELLKLCGLPGPIDKNTVLEYLNPQRVESVFDLTKALGQKNKARALGLLDNLLLQGQSELGVLALVLRHFRILLLTQDALQRGLQGPGLAQHIQVPLFFAKEYVQQAYSWSYAQLNKALIYVHETDKRIKSSPLPARTHLEALVLNLV